MQKTRRETILEIIEKEEIKTQRDLLESLRERGFDATQATVSRDIKKLNLIKQPVSGGSYKYARTVASEEKFIKYRSIVSESIIKIDHAVNICVVKCRPGTANAVCAAVDAIDINDVAGTLAGDDTIFIACRSERSALNVENELQSLLEG